MSRQASLAIGRCLRIYNAWLLSFYGEICEKISLPTEFGVRVSLTPISEGDENGASIIKGYYDPDHKLISVYYDSDSRTWLHELAHYHQHGELGDKEFKERITRESTLPWSQRPLEREASALANKWRADPEIREVISRYEAITAANKYLIKFIMGDVEIPLRTLMIPKLLRKLEPEDLQDASIWLLIPYRGQDEGKPQLNINWKPPLQGKFICHLDYERANEPQESTLLKASIEISKSSYDELVTLLKHGELMRLKVTDFPRCKITSESEGVVIKSEVTHLSLLDPLTKEKSERLIYSQLECMRKKAKNLIKKLEDLKKESLG